jgi:hypothetical protein
MNNVFTFDPHARATEERKAELLSVLEEIKNRIESGEIKEFVACSMDQEGTANIHVSALDLPGSIGLFEIGKHILIQTEV